MAAEEEIDGNRFSLSDGSDPNPCPVCLGPIIQDAYLDTCFHKFCYACITQWIKVVAGKLSRPLSSVKCPLCKTENFSIIHNYSGDSFERHYINQNIADSFVLSKEHRYRLTCYYTEPGFLADVFDIPRFWRTKKFSQSNRWLESWLQRELQAIMQEENVDIVLHHLLGVINSFCKRTDHRDKHEARSMEKIQEEFRAMISEAARPFIMGRTDRFVDEIELFLASGLNMEAYDAVYVQRLNWNNPRGTVAVDERKDDNTSTLVTPYQFMFGEDSDYSD